MTKQDYDRIGMFTIEHLTYNPTKSKGLHRK